MTVSTGTTFQPPAGPTISGRNITLDTYLNNPLRVAADVRALAADYFLADRIFAPGGSVAGSGAVIYDQLVGSEFYFTGRDVQAINPGQEFPLLDMAEGVPLVARTTKWGGSLQFTYEDLERNRVDKLASGLTRLRNTVTRKVDAVGMAVLRAAPIVQATASASWALAGTNIVKDVMTAMAAVDALDLGYTVDTAIVSPVTALNLMTNDKLNNMIGQSNGAIASPLASRQLDGVLGLTWYPTPRVSDNEVLLVAGRSVGRISDERPLYTRVVDDPERERRIIMAGRLTVPYVTDPKACIRITGVQ